VPGQAELHLIAQQLLLTLRSTSNSSHNIWITIMSKLIVRIRNAALGIHQRAAQRSARAQALLCASSNAVTAQGGTRALGSGKARHAEPEDQAQIEVRASYCLSEHCVGCGDTSSAPCLQVLPCVLVCAAGLSSALCMAWSRFAFAFKQRHGDETACWRVAQRQVCHRDGDCQ
jgi:hypothetical protein